MQLEIFLKKTYNFPIELRVKPTNSTYICLWAPYLNYYVIAPLYVNWLIDKNVILVVLFSAMGICNLKSVTFLYVKYNIKPSILQWTYARKNDTLYTMKVNFERKYGRKDHRTSVRKTLIRIQLTKVLCDPVSPLWWHSGQIKQSEVMYVHRGNKIPSVSAVLRWRRIQISDLQNIIKNNFLLLQKK